MVRKLELTGTCELGNMTYNGDERSEEQEPNEVMAAASLRTEVSETTTALPSLVAVACRRSNAINTFLLWSYAGSARTLPSSRAGVY